MNQEEKLLAVPYTLRMIYLQDSHLRMVNDFDPTIPGQKVGGQFRNLGGQVITKETEKSTPDGTVGESFRSCTFVTRFEFRYYRIIEDDTTLTETEEVKEARLVAEISADIAVDYILSAPEMPSKDQLESWGKSNALLHSWPYWREYCHASMSRMNLPVTMIPLLQLKPKPKVVEEEEPNTPPKLP